MLTKQLSKNIKLRKGLKDSYWYLRGIAPQEAKEAFFGGNGRLQRFSTYRRTISTGEKPVFQMSEKGQGGIDWEVAEEISKTAYEYAERGSCYEFKTQASCPGVMFHDIFYRDCRSCEHQGYLLMYRFNQELPSSVHLQKVLSGDISQLWRTVSILPNDAESKNLWAIIEAPFMVHPKDSGVITWAYKYGSKAAFGPAHPLYNSQTSEQFFIQRQIS